MNNIKDKILEAREERWKKICSKITESNVVVSLKANFPGDDKQNSLAYMIIQIAKSEIHFENQVACEFYDGYDGPYYLYVIDNTDGNVIKDYTVKIEQKSEIGRLYDIDVFSKDKKYERKIKRKCIICDKMAFECSREKNHNILELKAIISQIVMRRTTEILRDLLEIAFITELNLDPKFGLVTPSSNGSHIDMNYHMMKNSIDVILPFLIEMFEYSYGNYTLEEKILLCKEIGKIAEREMLKSTNNVNTYKGLIYNIGIFMISTSYGFSGAYPHFDIFDNAMDIYKILNFYNSHKTVSYDNYMSDNVYSIGARFEAEHGYPTVQNALPLLKDKSQESLFRTLVYIIQHTGDSVLLKRSKSFEEYKYNISKFNEININDLSQLRELTSYFIKKNVSFGGSADLLVLSVFIKDFFSIFNI